ncbi:4Fe-4S binding protein, partial [bacterium]|nr:4Fe-4S binding protein [bacterium]
ITGASIFLIIIFLIAIFKKNYFCTTMCPVSFLTFLSGKIKTKKFIIKKNIYSRSVYFIIAFFFALQNITYFVVFPFIYFLPPYNLIKIAFISVFFITSIFIPRFWCNTLCPLGFFFDRFHIKLNTEDKQ